MSVIISDAERETAIKVLFQSQHVLNWLTNQCKAYGVDINSPAGQKFKREQGRAYILKLIRPYRE